MFTRFITSLIIGAALLISALSSPLFLQLSASDHSMAASGLFQQSSPTVQISIDTVADVLIENSDGKRIGFDFSTKNFVNEIPGARSIDRETSATFVLPSDKAEKAYQIGVSGKSGSALTAILSIAGPGFINGFRSLPMPPGKIQRMSVSSDGTALSLTANQDGSTPQLYFTNQSGRDKPSYRFEVSARTLSPGKTISVKLDLAGGRLSFNSDDPRKTSFSVMMRRTKPGGTRETYNQQDVSFGRANNYALDFGNWDGKGDGCFYEKCSGCSESQCTKLKNEYLPPKN